MADDGGSSGLEQFCLLAKTAKARACVALVQQVLAEKKIFVFGELLAMPNVQEVSTASFIAVHERVVAACMLVMS
jgi:COP9 signalosome complex subunit 7